MTLKCKARLIRGLIQGQVAASSPPYLCIDPTRRCNTRCIGCFSHSVSPSPGGVGGDRTEDLPFELVLKICRELRGSQTEESFLVGEGEPFLHPDILKIISTFKQAGVRVNVTTNGTLIDHEMARHLIRSRLDVLRVTFWAVNNREHEKWHPGAELSMLDRRMAGLESLVREKASNSSKKPLIHLNLPITKFNYLNIKERVNLIKTFKVDALSFRVFRNCERPFEELTLTPAEVDHIRTELLDLQRSLDSEGISHNIGEYLAVAASARKERHRAPCYAGWLQLFVTVDGTCVPGTYCRIKMGSLQEQSMADIWNGERLSAFRRHGLISAERASQVEACYCANCCQVIDNMMLHRFLRWILPLACRQL